MSINLQIKSVQSTQDWTKDPDMIEVSIGIDLLEKARKSIQFMLENNISYCCSWFGANFEMYQVADESDPENIKGEDGLEYCLFDPEYAIEGGHIKVYASGGMDVVIPFKHTSDELWVSLGTVEDLLQKVEAGASKPSDQ